MLKGEVWLSIIVTATGVAAKPVVTRSVGFGLDEEAVSAVLAWRFKPATRSGMPVEKLATVAIRFHMQGGGRKPQEELRRHIKDLSKQTDVKKAAIIAARIKKLANEWFSPAMYEYGKLQRDGKIVPRDETEANEFILDAAKLKYGPAIWDVVQADISINGPDPLRRTVRELTLRAADFGSTDAQHVMAKAFENGSAGYAVHIDEARRWYTICAGGGHKECQYHAGRLLLLQDNCDKDDTSRALAWLELAQAQGVEDARALLDSASAALTSVDKKDVQLAKKKFVAEIGSRNF